MICFDYLNSFKKTVLFLYVFLSKPGRHTKGSHYIGERSCAALYLRGLWDLGGEESTVAFGENQRESSQVPSTVLRLWSAPHVLCSSWVIQIFSENIRELSGIPMVAPSWEVVTLPLFKKKGPSMLWLVLENYMVSLSLELECCWKS